MSFFERLRTQKLLTITVMVLTLSIGIVIGTLVNSGVKAARDSSAAPDATPLVIPSPVELSNSFAQIAKQVEPSVVNIQTSFTPKSNRQTLQRRGRPVPQQDDDEDGNGGMDDLFNRFFGSPFGNGVPGVQPRGSATGSGVVIDPAGYILTNNHVVDKADRIQVKFPHDPVQYEAKVIGVDAPTDLAVIRVTGKKNPPVAKIGNSDAVRVGDWAVAIGSPFGFQATVTAGIISAKERDIQGESSQFQHFLQTDAAINPGNSGGPLLNTRGEVIGINTAIASRSGGFQGVGFALPINTAASVYNDIIKNGKVTRGSIGIKFTPSDRPDAQALLQSYGGVSEGVFVQSVAPGGPAEKAGLRDGDIIVAINGKPVKEGNELVNTIVSTPVGTALDLTVLRDKKRQNLKVVVGDLAQVFPDEFGGVETAQNKTGVSANSFGMNIRNITEQLRQTLNLKEKGGVVVDSVEPNSFAEDVGLLKGDVVVSINQQPVTSTDDVMKLRGNLKPGTAVAFRVLRQQGRSGPWVSTHLAGTLPN